MARGRLLFVLSISIIVLAGCPEAGITSTPVADPSETGDAPPDELAIPTGLAVTSNSDAVTLSVVWDAVPDASGYHVYRDSSESGTFTSKVYNGTATTFADIAVEPLTTYYYRVQSVFPAGSSDLCAPASGTTIFGFPVVTVEAVSQTTVTISWPEVYDADSYKVVGWGGGTQPHDLDGPWTSPYTHSGLLETTEYTYQVLAYREDNGTTTTHYDIVSATTRDPSPPTAPTGLTVSLPAATSLTVSWDAEPDATSYVVYRGDSAGGSYATRIFEGTTRSFINSGLSAEETYYYEVEAYIGVTPGPRSTVASGTTGSGAVSSTYTLEQLTNNANAVFGSLSTSSNSGGGQSLTMGQNVSLDSFAFYLSLPYGYPSQPFTLRLDVRDSNGTILATNARTVATLSEGWFTWDGFGGPTLTSGETYIFTSYVLDAMSNGAKFSIHGDSGGSYADGTRYTSQVQTNLDLALWSHEAIVGGGPDAGSYYTAYHYVPATWDLMFQLNGH